MGSSPVETTARLHHDTPCGAAQVPNFLPGTCFLVHAPMRLAARSIWLSVSSAAARVARLAQVAGGSAPHLVVGRTQVGDQVLGRALLGRHGSKICVQHEFCASAILARRGGKEHLRYR